MLRRAMDQITDGLGHRCGVIPGREMVAEVVLGKSPLAALMLTSMIEWFTQLHYLEHVRDDADLDTLFRDILRYHWIDEAQHAKADTLLIQEIVGDLSAKECETAVDEVLELGGAINGMLADQIAMDIDALEAVTARRFTAEERDEIATAQQRSYRWTFLVSGLQHPNFVETVAAVTTAGPGKLEATATALAA